MEKNSQKKKERNEMSIYLGTVKTDKTGVSSFVFCGRLHARG
jgi:hypothetical protein